MIKATNVGYERSKIFITEPDGTVKLYNFKDLGYPYFYSSNNIVSSNVVKSYRETIKLLLPNEIAEMPMYKIYVRTPNDIPFLREKSTLSVEDDISYIERRLGADRVIEWTKPENYALIDAEVNAKGEIFLMGVIPYIKGKRMPYIFFTDMDEFIRWLSEARIALVGAFNGSGYDYRFLDERYKYTYWKYPLHLDLLDVYAKWRHKQRRSLDYILKEEGFAGKIEIDKSIWKQKEIPVDEKMIEYNKQDCVGMANLVDKYDLIGAVYSVSKETGVTPLKMNESLNWEGYVMLHRDELPEPYKGIKLIGHQEPKERVDFEGGLVIANKFGIVENVGAVDYTSLYPNVIINNNYDNRKNMVYNLMQITVKIFFDGKQNNRKLYAETKNQQYKLKSEAFKVMANGTGYGIWALPYWRYSDWKVAAFITEKAREKLKELSDIIESKNYKVVYGDTDSCFIENISKEDAGKLVEEINKIIYPYEVKLEKYFKRMIFSGNEEEGAKKKKYAGLDESGNISITGFELIRSDRCLYLKRVQREAINVILYSPIEKAYENAKLLINKRMKPIINHSAPIKDLVITKSIDADRVYKANQPHIRAYKKMREKGEARGIISFVGYVIGKNGTILIESEIDEFKRQLIDWDYYYRDQVYPALKRLLDSIKPTDKSIFSYV